MNAYQLFKRSKGQLSFLLLDRYRSRPELNFIEHVNNPEYKWVTCIRVLYRTSLQQVRDSSKQNKSFNMEITQAKAKLIQLKNNMLLLLNLVLTDTILLINQAQEYRFARKDTNKKAIVECGQYLYN